MKKTLLTLLALGLMTVSAFPKQQPVDYVNTRIGNISHLLVPTYPTVHLPNSMLRMIPAHNEFVTDRMEGIPLNVPSHRQGSVLLLRPYCGDLQQAGALNDYRYDQERITPYSYSVFLDDQDVVLDFVPQAHSGLFTLRYERAGDRCLFLKPTGQSELKCEGNVISGYDLFRGVKHYVYIELEQTPVASGTEDGMFYVSLGKEPDVVRFRYGISYIGPEQAARNLHKEITGYEAKPLIAKARDAWNDVLGKISIKGGSEDEKVVFYTALYRSHERMINLSEEGRYFSGFDGKVHEDGGVDFWTDDWIWDTYLALHPLQIILNPAAEAQKINSYLRMAEQADGGWVPTFPCVFGDAHCMNGNHAAVMFADALCKGIPFDVAKAFEYMKHTVMTESMIPWYRGPKTRIDDFYHTHGWSRFASGRG